MGVATMAEAIDPGCTARANSTVVNRIEARALAPSCVRAAPTSCGVIFFFFLSQRIEIRRQLISLNLTCHFDARIRKHDRFYSMPHSALSALIIHMVGHL
jgi:hypothetical protein